LASSPQPPVRLPALSANAARTRQTQARLLARSATRANISTIRRLRPIGIRLITTRMETAFPARLAVTPLPDRTSAPNARRGNTRPEVSAHVSRARLDATRTPIRRLAITALRASTARVRVLVRRSRRARLYRLGVSREAGQRLLRFAGWGSGLTLRSLRRSVMPAARHAKAAITVRSVLPGSTIPTARKT
jgi:hypothetical protein